MNFSPMLSRHGLNMQEVFNLSQLPEKLTNALAEQLDLSPFSQLILFAHGGNRLWQAVQESGHAQSDNPIDSFSVDMVRRFFEDELNCNYHCIYPEQSMNIPLRELGKLAGWHHATPFRLGIHPEYGSWFAYRVAALSDSNLPATTPACYPHPCDACVEKSCIKACPADALSEALTDESGLEQCMDYRLLKGSLCQSTCLSRCACPVGDHHRYSKTQLQYNYNLSLQSIKEMHRGKL